MLLLLVSASTDNIPEPQLFTHSIINTHPVDKMLKMECIEEPLSETQLSSTMKLEDMTDYDRVAATLEQLVEDYGGKLVRQTGVISYEYTLPANQTATPTIVPDNPQISNVTQQKENSAPIKLESDNISEPQENVQLESEPCAGANLEPVTQTQGTTTTTTSSVASTNTQTQQKENYMYNKSGRKIERVIYVRQPDAIQKIDEAKKNQSSDGESTFNRMEDDLFARSFPSLMVVVRPSIRDKYIRSQVAHTERRALAKFTEWLFEQGLVKSRQYCSHHSTKSEKVNLKLEMYSVRGTFPYSGGYVWSSNCCPDRYVSVFSGSVFQEAPYMPTVLLKLIYHWACQTDVQNVVSWVKVSNIYLKNFYTNLRSICTAAVWDKTRKMGGKNSVIQVGVISLGTTSQDGHLRQVKVGVLGVLDPVTSDLRLRACDPTQDEDRSFKRRFNNTL
ncbi:hypothetical protein DMN91_012247 [Ooceraea biroi]|uniref:Uncharacterized protein n=1 Tax=Ooceraea biroi TaxID=2015173 RepID=A0A3L8D5F7_OOCBI|nr:hypothetical protein DMN91_012247 [Ooceraea biroi]